MTDPVSSRSVRGDPFERELATEFGRLTEGLVQTRRDLHRHPELGFHERRTAALIAQRCSELGLDVKTAIGGTGVIADVSGHRAGPTVLLRADMDALPIDEGDDGRPYRSLTQGVMHACGHDGHVAVALGAAHALASLRSRWPGRVRFCFQPAEEIDAGAARMIADGALVGVDYAVGLHLQAGVQTGLIEIGAGLQWGSSDEISVEIRGIGGHAGDPDQTIVNPILVAAEVVCELSQLTREAQTVLAIAQIQGGTAANVSPQTVTLRGTVRALEASERLRMLSEATHRAHRISAKHGATAEVLVGVGCPPVMCDAQTTQRIRNTFAAAFGPEHIRQGTPSTGSDDMARFLQQVPGTYFRVGASDLEAATKWFPHHHPLFDLDERALPIACEALVRAALALLSGE